MTKFVNLRMLQRVSTVRRGGILVFFLSRSEEGEKVTDREKTITKTHLHHLCAPAYKYMFVFFNIA